MTVDRSSERFTIASIVRHRLWNRMARMRHKSTRRPVRLGKPPATLDLLRSSVEPLGRHPDPIVQRVATDVLAEIAQVEAEPTPLALKRLNTRLFRAHGDSGHHGGLWRPAHSVARRLLVQVRRSIR